MKKLDPSQAMILALDHYNEFQKHVENFSREAGFYANKLILMMDMDSENLARRLQFTGRLVQKSPLIFLGARENAACP